MGNTASTLPKSVNHLETVYSAVELLNTCRVKNLHPYDLSLRSSYILEAIILELNALLHSASA